MLLVVEYDLGGWGGGGRTPNNGLYGLLVYERVGILLVEIYKRVGKSVIRVCEKAQKG